MKQSEKITRIQAALCAKWGGDPAVFSQPEHLFFPSKSTFFEVITFGAGALFRGDAGMLAWCRERFTDTPARWVMDSENLYAIEAELRKHGKQLCGEHLQYIYGDITRIVPQPQDFRYVLFRGDEVQALYTNKDFGNALNYTRDVIALAAYVGDTLAALAAADDYLAGDILQIGIDTLPAYRHRGLATYLVKTLSDIIEADGNVTYYTTWSANLASTRVALACGYLPAWVGYHTET